MDYFIGDTHFGGEDIIKFCGRPFKNSQEMDDTIINNWNLVVTNEDTVFVNGDFFDNLNVNYVNDILRKLNYKKIVLIIGNHDKEWEDFYIKKGIVVVPYPIIYKDYFIISHEPMYVSTNQMYANIFAHVHDDPRYKDYSARSFCTSAERINYTPISFDRMLNAMKGAAR